MTMGMYDEPAHILRPVIEAGRRVLVISDIHANLPYFHGLLDKLRSTGQTVRLKAVVTEHNSSWSAVRLHRELLAEAAAMEKQASLKRQSSSHSKRRK